MNLLTRIKQHQTECICFAVYIVLAVFGFCVHEMWYDEAQAWQIARTAPFYDILFVVPHLEGHPPFWHLLLAIPAKLGMYWQWGVSIVGILFMLANGFLIFFKAPFPRWVRCLLPFNYFLFYQYGIIVRPYGPLLLVMLLLAIYFPQKDKRSTLYVGLLVALCACHIFGIAIAGGITLAWLWDLKDHRPWKQYITALLKDSRFHKLLFLLGFVVVLFLEMKQTDGVLDRYLAFTRSIFKHLIYVLFALPTEAVLTNVGNTQAIMKQYLTWSSLLPAGAIGLLLWTTVLLCLPRKRLLYLVLPYLCLGTIFLHYISRHHIGIVLILFIWYAWITLQEFSPAPRLPHAFKSLAKTLLGLILVFPISWTLYAVCLDYKVVIFPGKQVVAFLEKYNLTGKTIFSSWDIYMGKNALQGDPNVLPLATMLNVFLPHNIIANFNNGSEEAYLINRRSTEDETTQAIINWRSHGLPDVLLGSAALPMLYNDPDLLNQYHAAFISKLANPWKFERPSEQEYIIYLHQNLWNDLKEQIIADSQSHA